MMTNDCIIRKHYQVDLAMISTCPKQSRWMFSRLCFWQVSVSPFLVHTKPVSNLDTELFHNMQVMVQGLMTAFTWCTARREEKVTTRPLTQWCWFTEIHLLLFWQFSSCYDYTKEFRNSPIKHWMKVQHTQVSSMAEHIQCIHGCSTKFLQPDFHPSSAIMP